MPHVSVARREKAICRHPVWSFLQGKKQQSFGFLKLTGEKVANAYSEVSVSGERAIAWAETYGSLEMLDREIGISRP